MPAIALIEFTAAIKYYFSIPSVSLVGSHFTFDPGALPWHTVLRHRIQGNPIKYDQVKMQIKIRDSTKSAEILHTCGTHRRIYATVIVSSQTVHYLRIGSRTENKYSEMENKHC